MIFSRELLLTGCIVGSGGILEVCTGGKCGSNEGYLLAS
jgi:hypothetical protein